VRARPRKQTLRQFRRQVRHNLHFAFQYPVRLGMYRANGMTIIISRPLQNDVKSLLQALDRFRFIWLKLFDVAGKTDGRVEHGHSPFQH